MHCQVFNTWRLTFHKRGFLRRRLVQLFHINFGSRFCRGAKILNLLKVALCLNCFGTAVLWNGLLYKSLSWTWTAWFWTCHTPSPWQDNHCRSGRTHLLNLSKWQWPHCPCEQRSHWTQAVERHIMYICTMYARRHQKKELQHSTTRASDWEHWLLLLWQCHEKHQSAFCTDVGDAQVMAVP